MILRDELIQWAEDDLIPADCKSALRSAARRLTEFEERILRLEGALVKEGTTRKRDHRDVFDALVSDISNIIMNTQGRYVGGCASNIINELNLLDQALLWQMAADEKEVEVIYRAGAESESRWTVYSGNGDGHGATLEAAVREAWRTR